MKRRREDASRIENLESIGDIGEFEELTDLAKKVDKFSNSSKSKVSQNDVSSDVNLVSLPSAMKRTLNAFSQ